MDMGAVGNKFTRVRRVRGGELVSKKLDRVLIDCRWRTMFPEAFTENLSRNYSDHSPILLHCGVLRVMRGRPFWLVAWTTHPGFHQVVEDAWSR